ncbi:EHD2 protein, partial [Syrrhaptes paradoxus]|nr:EHD2 protein [Syrrhaptes paradoxus]
LTSGYDFPAVLQWFAERVDLIILLFDAHKLEISDEFSEAIRALKGNEDKIRVVLNKADMVETQQLMRVYGALMWSLGKVINTPEVLRVFIGSFWAQPLLNAENRRLFELEEQDLFQDIQNLPRNAALRRLNDLVKRARLVRVRAGGVLSPPISQFWGVYGVLSPPPQFWGFYWDPDPPHSYFGGSLGLLTPPFRPLPPQEQLLVHDFTRFPGLKPRLLAALDELLTTDIAALMPLLRQEELDAPENLGVQGGAFDGTRQGPFGGLEEDEEEGEEDEEWAVMKDKAKYDEIFYGLAPLGGKLSGRRARGWMVSSNLPSSVLGRIWQLSDVDRDGMLDAEEFALAGHLIGVKLEGRGLPTDLPPRLVPPSKRRPKG